MMNIQIQKHRNQMLLLCRILSQTGFKTQRIDWKGANHFVEISKTIENYIMNFSNHLRQGIGMIWQGGSDLAKSTLSLYVLYRLMAEGYQVHYEESMENFEYLTSVENEAIEKYQFTATQFDLLILDDFNHGLKVLSQEAISILKKILILREKQKLPILFLTSSSIEDLKQNLPIELFSLLFSIKNKVIYFKWINTGFS